MGSISENVDEDVKFGFKRPEMYSQNLCGTVIPYERHLLLARAQSSMSDLLYERLAQTIKERINSTAVQTLLTICDVCDGTGLSDGDVLIIPDMIIYRGLEEAKVDSFVEEVGLNGKAWDSAKKVRGWYVLVCRKTNGEKRCGVCGPGLVEKLNEEIEVRGLKDKVFVIGSGGHMFAGHLIIYSAVQDRDVSGHWGQMGVVRFEEESLRMMTKLLRSMVL